MLRKLIILIFLLVSLSPLMANPFIGGGQERLPDRPRQGGIPIQKLVDWQNQLRSSMADLFASEGSGPLALLSLLGLSFLYGMAHAAGPGHRKSLVFALFLGRKSKWWEPFASGFYLAGLHSLSGLGLILVLYALSGRNINLRSNKASLYFEAAAYIALGLIALAAVVLQILEMRSHKESRREVKRGAALTAGGFLPCPAVIMITIFCINIGRLGTGVLAVLALSLGMGVVISLSALLARAGNRGIFGREAEENGRLHFWAEVLETAGYVFLFFFALWALLPFLLSLPGLRH